MINFDMIFVLSIFIITIAALIKYPSYPEHIFGIVFLFLYSTGKISTQQVVESMFNQGLLTLLILMTCSLAIEKTNFIKILSRQIIRPSYVSTWIRLYIVTVISSAFFNNTAVVSTMIGPLHANPQHSASRLLLPLSYAAIFGGTLTLIGTSTNLLINTMVLNVQQPALHFFDFTIIGLVIIFACGFVLFFASLNLPNNLQSKNMVDEYFIETKVLPGSPLIGKSVEENSLRKLNSLFLFEIIRNGRLISPVAPNEIIYFNDRLLFSGDINKIHLLDRFDGLCTNAVPKDLPITNLVEVIIRQDSVILGKTIKTIGFRALFNAAVLSIIRDDKRITGELGNTVLQAGDHLILAVGEDFYTRKNIDKNFYFFKMEIKSTSLLKGIKEKFVLIGFFTSIAISAMGYVPMFKVMIILLGLLILFHCLSFSEIQQRFPKQIWIIISSALMLSHALENSGIFSIISKLIQTHQYQMTPLIGLLLIYALTWLLTELITNSAAAAVIFPIANNLAINLGVNPVAYILAVAFAASASFINPYGYQTNLMVFQIGQYHLIDFIRVGLPISIMYTLCVLSMLSILYL